MLSVLLEFVGGAIETTDGSAGSIRAARAKGVTSSGCAAVKSVDDIAVASSSVHRVSREV